MLEMSPFGKKKYWVTLCSTSETELALFGDVNGKYYCTKNGIFTPPKSFHKMARIIVEKVPFKNEVREVLTGVTIPTIFIEVMKGEKSEISSKGYNVIENYSSSYITIGDTSSLLFAFALLKHVQKGKEDQQFELIEATSDDLKKYQEFYSSKESWQHFLNTLVQSKREEKRRILEENKDRLAQKKKRFGLFLK